MVKFSIVVVCLNAGARLQETVDSILAQTYGNYEIIVKDGLSSDGSVEKLQKDGRIRIFSRQDKGIYDAMNQAVAEITGDYVYFLNCGDRFRDKNVLHRVAEKIDHRAETKLKRQRYIFYGDIFEQITQERVASNPSINAFGCYRNVPCHQACFYQAKLMKEKQFDIRYRVRADYEHFLWCFFRGNAETVYMPFLIADYEGGGFSETKENLKRSKKEHREITGRYMTVRQLLAYRLIMVVTLAPLRTWLAGNQTTAHVYNRVKGKLYRG